MFEGALEKLSTGLSVAQLGGLLGVLPLIVRGTSPGFCPLSLETAASMVSTENRAGICLSADGLWLAQTYQTNDLRMGDPRYFSETGFSLGEGELQSQAQLTNTQTGRVVELGPRNACNWNPVWSPDGQRVAYYSDEGGTAGLWIWDRATEKKSRFPGIVARPFFGFEAVRWFSDSQRLVCKILPEGVSVAEANHVVPDLEGANRFSATEPGRPSVFVLSAGGSPEPKPSVRPSPSTTYAYQKSDLAILDLRDLSVRRLIRGEKPRWYALSPDGRYLACTIFVDSVPGAPRPSYSLVIVPLDRLIPSVEVKNLTMAYGIELSWSPDSQRLAYVTGGYLSTGEPILISLDGTVTPLTSPGLPSFSDGKRGPLWDFAGKNLLLLGQDGQLWRVPISGKGAEVTASIPAHSLEAIFHRMDSPVPWTSDGGRTCWAVAVDREAQTSGIARIDFSTGVTTVSFEQNHSIETQYSLEANYATGDLAFVAEDQQHPSDTWLFSTRDMKARQASSLNSALSESELGSARLIEWKDSNGKKLRGTLLLPPGSPKGRLCPLVVWVYGSASGPNEYRLGHGSRYLNSFGIGGELPIFNFHILATRGFAILYPDAPLRTGKTRKDLLATVMPGVDAAIAAGYVDPDRLAVMGQSYGAYCALSLITQTTRFKAAVITAAVGHPDFVSDYLMMSPDGSYDGTTFYENGQGNLGATPWSDRSVFIENSPVFFFDQITTPLLIGQGSSDGRLLGSDAIFVGLRRLGKKVEYRVYENESHVILRRANVIDFWVRRLEFFAENLDLAYDEKGVIAFEGNRAKSRETNARSNPAGKGRAP